MFSKKRLLQLFRGYSTKKRKIVMATGANCSSLFYFLKTEFQEKSPPLRHEKVRLYTRSFLFSCGHEIDFFDLSLTLHIWLSLTTTYSQYEINAGRKDILFKRRCSCRIECLFCGIGLHCWSKCIIPSETAL